MHSIDLSDAGSFQHPVSYLIPPE